VVLGLHPRISKYLSSPPPTSLEELLTFGDRISELMPTDDEFWTAAESTQYRSPEVTITLENEYAVYVPANPNKCNKCDIQGHFAFQCPNPRVKGLRPPRKRKRTSKRKTGFLRVQAGGV
jgi:hypothetical protein